MFHWRYKGIYTVLTDQEENHFINLAADNATQKIQYMTSREIRRLLEKRISRLLKKEFLHDPEAFGKKYVHRIAYGPEAQRVFEMLLDAYGRITRLAVLGDQVPMSAIESLPEIALYKGCSDLVTVTLLSAPRFPPIGLRPTGRLRFLASSIEEVRGTPDNFVLMTRAFSANFARRFVRISVYPAIGGSR